MTTVALSGQVTTVVSEIWLRRGLLKELGYTCDKGIWTSSPEAVAHLANVADKMHALLVARADELDGCTEGSPEEAEYIKVVEAIEVYEAERWPEGHIPGGKG